MTDETALGEKMKAAGVDTALARLYTAASTDLFQHADRVDLALKPFVCKVMSEPELLDALALHFLREVAEDMKGLPGEGQHTSANSGQDIGADARQQNGSGEGHALAADKASTSVPSTAATHREQTGHREPADKAPLVVPVAREPSKAQRNAAIEARKVSAKAVLEYGWVGDAAMPAGPAYRDMLVGEALMFRKRQVRETVNHGRSAVVIARFIRELEKLGQADPNAKVFDVLPPETIRQISRETEMDVIGQMAAGWVEGFIKGSELAIEGGHHNG
jgi:hypothetical protein